MPYEIAALAVLTVIVGLLHGALIIASELILFKDGFGLDHPEIEPSRLQQACGALLDSLMQPGEAVWTALGITPRSSLLEWSMLISNSLVWGATVALIIVLLNPHERSLDTVNE